MICPFRKSKPKFLRNSLIPSKNKTITKSLEYNQNFSFKIGLVYDLLLPFKKRIVFGTPASFQKLSILSQFLLFLIQKYLFKNPIDTALAREAELLKGSVRFKFSNILFIPFYN